MNWLAEFYRRWHAARGKRVSGSSRAFLGGLDEAVGGCGHHQCGRPGDGGAGGGGVRAACFETASLPEVSDRARHAAAGFRAMADRALRRDGGRGFAGGGAGHCRGVFRARAFTVSSGMDGALRVAARGVFARSFAAAVPLEPSGDAAAFARCGEKTQRTRVAGGHLDPGGECGHRAGFERTRTPSADIRIRVGAVVRGGNLPEIAGPRGG